jgi:hypothetical protein
VIDQQPHRSQRIDALIALERGVVRDVVQAQHQRENGQRRDPCAPVRYVWPPAQWE